MTDTQSPPEDQPRIVILSVDGNCGCALLGTNIQEGEAEFEPLADNTRRAEINACGIALRRLEARLGLGPLRYTWEHTPYAGG